MKKLNEYISINEGVKLPDDKLNIIEKFLNDENRYDFNKTIVCDVLNQFDNVATEIIADIAGYLVEAYIWDQMHKLITNKEFCDVWFDGNNKSSEEFKLSPLARRNNKDNNGSAIYWDFTINGIDEKFEIKARSTKEGKKNGGYRFTVNQSSDKNLIYILVEYSISGDEINIGNIKITRKL